MATEEAKKANQLRLANLTLFGLTAGLWNLVGDTAFALSGKIGDEVLALMEKEMGLEIAGETPQDVASEISRLFVDEFGMASDIQVESAENKISLKVTRCINKRLTDQLQAAGVEKPFICPIMNATLSALKRLGVKARANVEPWPEGEGSVITFQII